MKKAMFSIKTTKNLGPDGYSSGFFRNAWDIVGEDITNAVLEYLNNGKLLG